MPTQHASLPSRHASLPPPSPRTRRQSAAAAALLLLLPLSWPVGTSCALSPHEACQKLKNLAQFEDKVFSQNGEDGITLAILDALGLTSPPRASPPPTNASSHEYTHFFVEFGAADGVECNARILRERLRMPGLQMDGGHEGMSKSLNF